jgi:hypothetical protein
MIRGLFNIACNICMGMIKIFSKTFHLLMVVVLMAIGYGMLATGNKTSMWVIGFIILCILSAVGEEKKNA